MPSNIETYSVTITFGGVRGVSDLMLRLVRMLGWIDNFHDMQGFSKLIKRRQPISVRQNGRLTYGAITVVKDA